MIRDCVGYWVDRITAYIAYCMSALGIAIDKLNWDQVYSIGSLLLGLAMLCVNIWHKRQMQKIAKEQGVTIDVN